MDVGRLAERRVLEGDDVDATSARERARQRRLARLTVVLGLLATWLWFRALSGNPVGWGWPRLPEGRSDLVISIGLTAVLVLVIAVPLLAAGRSPHVVLRPGDTRIRLDDVVGADATKREAIDTLNLFLAHRTFATEMGGQPRRGVLFEGPPGTGKTYLAKALAGEAGVPFLFVSASAFQSMYYGQTNRKIRSYFKALRKLARLEGGSIGFIEEFDAIGGARSNMGAGTTAREGVTGVVNELLVQMQSFDLPSGSRRAAARVIDVVNLLLPRRRQLPRPGPSEANVLLIAATNRAADLDPALLRPGRFDRIVHFDLPARPSRVAIARYYLGRKAHAPDVTAEQVANLTSGYSPVSIERLLDEALICALRQRRSRMTSTDVLEAKLVTELGVSQETLYEADERHRIALHEASHALVAELVGRHVTVASILKRSDALGLVAHRDDQERHVHTPSEARAVLQVAMAGSVAEQLELGEASSGVAADLAEATTIAARLVGAMGAGTSKVSFVAAQMAGASNLVAKVLADPLARTEVDRLLDQAEERARMLVVEHRQALHTLAAALEEHDELSGDQVREILVATGARPASASRACR